MIHAGERLSRRDWLRGSGVTMALPWLESMEPSLAGDRQPPPQRFVSISHGLGFHAPNFTPRQAGQDFELPLYLQPLRDLRHAMSVISGTSHPYVGGGHNSEPSFLTAAPHAGTVGYRNSISLDQYLAEALGNVTRFASLVLSTGNIGSSYTRSGAMIPPENSPSRLFARLFVDGTPAERQSQLRRLRTGRSIMDAVAEDANRLQRQVGPRDRQKLDIYFSTVREVERRLVVAEDWNSKAKPHVAVEPPVDIFNAADIVGRQQRMLQVMMLALQTDSTRFITLHLPDGRGAPPIDGVNESHHNLSHHGLDEAKIKQLELVEAAIIAEVGEFLRRLNSIHEGSSTLLDRTTVLLGSNLGNASNHDTLNLPILLAGGGFRHGHHLAFDATKNEPLPNLYLSLLRRHGLDDEHFVTSTGPLRGLEWT